MGEKLEPRYFRKGAEEGKRYTVDEAWFSYKDGLCFAKQNVRSVTEKCRNQKKVIAAVSMIC